MCVSRNRFSSIRGRGVGGGVEGGESGGWEWGEPNRESGGGLDGFGSGGGGRKDGGEGG